MSLYGQSVSSDWLSHSAVVVPSFVSEPVVNVITMSLDGETAGSSAKARELSATDPTTSTGPPAPAPVPADLETSPAFVNAVRTMVQAELRAERARTAPPGTGAVVPTTTTRAGGSSTPSTSGKYSRTRW